MKNVSVYGKTFNASCFTNEQHKKIEEIAKKKGMVNSSQGLESLLEEL